MLLFTGFINTTIHFDFELHTIKPEHNLKLVPIYGYDLSQKGREVIEARQQLSFQFLLKSHAMELILKNDVSNPIVCLNILPHQQCATNLKKLII